MNKKKGIFGRKPAATTESPKVEPSILINGCKIEGIMLRKLMSDLNRRNPEELQLVITNIFQEMNITGPISVLDNNLITEDGKTITFYGNSSSIWGPRYPNFTIATENTQESFSIKTDEILPTSFEITLDTKSLVFHYPNADNFDRPSIYIREGQYLLNINFTDEVDNIQRSPEMENELLNVTLTEAIKPADIYKIIRKYISLPARIELGWEESHFIYYFWKASIIDDKCVSYMESTLTEAKSDYALIKSVDLVHNEFRFETPHTEYSFKNGKFKFTTNSETFEAVYISCKAEITALKEKMKHLLD